MSQIKSEKRGRKKSELTVAERQKAYYQQNKEVLKKYAKDRYDKIKQAEAAGEIIVVKKRLSQKSNINSIERQKAYYQQNKEALKKYAKDRYDKMKQVEAAGDKAPEYYQQYYKENKARYLSNQRKYRDKIKKIIALHKNSM